MIEDYAYEGGNFCDEPNLTLPEGEEWDDRGKKDTTHHVFNFFKFISFLFVLPRQVEMVLCRHWTSMSTWNVAYYEVGRNYGYGRLSLLAKQGDWISRGETTMFDCRDS